MAMLEKIMTKKTPNPIDKHVGSRVRMRRMMIGMSQEKLGEKLGITFQQIQKYEKGTNRIGASRLQQIATVLSVPGFFFLRRRAGAGSGRGARFGAGFARLRVRLPRHLRWVGAHQGLHEGEGCEGAPAHRRSRRGDGGGGNRPPAEPLLGTLSFVRARP